MRMVSPPSRSARTSTIACWISAGFSPPITSSRQSTSGPVASARAISSRFSSPMLSTPAFTAARCASWVRVSTSSTRARAFAPRSRDRP